MLISKSAAKGPLFSEIVSDFTAAQKYILMWFNSSKAKLSLLKNTAERFLSN